MTAFAEKNRRRSEAKAKDQREYREGRAARKAYANDGAFGNLTGDQFDWCKKGTSIG